MTIDHHGALTSTEKRQRTLLAARVSGLVDKSRVSYSRLLGRKNPHSSPKAA